MNYTMTVTTSHRIVISSNFIVLLLLLLSGCLIGNAMVHQASAQNINNVSSGPYRSNNSILNVGNPHKVTIPFDSQQSTVLSDEKKQQLMQSHHKSPHLSSSGEPIHGPLPGTQTSMNKR